MSRPDYYIEIDGQPVAVSYEDWRKRFEKNLDWHVVAADVHVRTIFTGRTTMQPPQCYETLITGGLLDGRRSTYTTRAEALAGHQRWVERDAAATLEADRAEWARLKAVYGEGGP